MKLNGKSRFTLIFLLCTILTTNSKALTPDDSKEHITTSSFTAVSAGGCHNIALKSDGYLAAWGHDGYGQCSYIPAGNDIIVVSAGGWHNVALKNDGSLIVWGDNSHSQINLVLRIDLIFY